MHDAPPRPSPEHQTSRTYPIRVRVDLTEAQAERLAKLADELGGKGADPVLLRALRVVRHELSVARTVHDLVPNGRPMGSSRFGDDAGLLRRIAHAVRTRYGTEPPDEDHPTGRDDMAPTP